MLRLSSRRIYRAQRNETKRRNESDETGGHGARRGPLRVLYGDEDAGGPWGHGLGKVMK